MGMVKEYHLNQISQEQDMQRLIVEAGEAEECEFHDGEFYDPQSMGVISIEGWDAIERLAIRKLAADEVYRLPDQSRLAYLRELYAVYEQMPDCCPSCDDLFHKDD